MLTVPRHLQHGLGSHPVNGMAHTHAGLTWPDDTTEERPTARIILRKASAIKPRPARWLYDGRIPAGMLTVMAGREGIGKSTIWADLVARLTRGTLPGRYLGKPQNVVVCATEDSWAYTLSVRLIVAGADMDRVLPISVSENGRERPLSLPGDTAILDAAMGPANAVLMVLDPAMSVIHGDIDTNKQQQVQQALDPLVAMCDRRGAAVLALIHVNKSGGSDALNSIMASRAFSSLPRSVLYCIRDPEADDDDSFLFCHAKCNVGPRRPSIAYRIAGVRYEFDPGVLDEDDDTSMSVARIAWGEEDKRSADDVLEQAQQGRSKGECRTTLLDYINAQTGAVPRLLIIGAHPQFSASQIDNNLSRMATAGEIDKPIAGHYQSVKLRPGLSPSLESVRSEK